MSKKFAVAWGTTRVVFLVSDIAIKVPACQEWRLFLLGLLANMQEKTFWSTRWPELCPVVWALPGGWLTVMRRATPITRDEYDELDLENWVNQKNYRVPVEIKMDSFGWLDGRLVAVDYGN
jgi:hypothetical protein